MANAGLPGTSGFVGEFVVIMASIKVNFWYAFFAAISLITGAAYTLWMYKRVVFGPIVHPGVEALDDVNIREIFVLAVLALAVLWMGLYPLPLMEVMHTTVDDLLAHVARSKL
jgi:NADH-quinone oxidoreductase subunit M